MKKLLWLLLLPLLFAAIPPRTAAAQSDYNLKDPFQILTYSEFAQCIPQQRDQGLANYAGCCGSPGQRSCATGYLNLGIDPVCLAVSPSLQGDSYGGQPLCSLPSLGIDPALSSIGLSGTDLTFFVTSDIHYYRSTFNLTDQLSHVRALNLAPQQPNLVWPHGIGIPAGTHLAVPAAVVIDGDITTHGQPQDLGAFRLNYERGTVPDSIHYPVLFGLGNHDTKTNNSADNAHRMFDYLESRMANTHLDPGSGNYSWDWLGVHMVQLNTWAGDQTSLYAHFSDGLGWLRADLQRYVGNSTKPVMIFQHYRLPDVGDWWPTDAAATDGAGNPTHQGYESFFNAVKNYNVIGMFSGHDHCLGIFSTDSTKYPAGASGATFPEVASYGQSIDNFDDGSGGDTTSGQDAAGIRSPCPNAGATTVGNFLATHISQHYLDVGAISWGGNGSDIFFDPNIGFPNGSAACRKRIDSQFIPVPASVATATSSGNGYTIKNVSGADITVPLALQVLAAGATGYDFADSCGGSAPNAYYLVNGEQGLGAGQSVSTASNPSSATLVALTPMSGVTPSNFLHTTAFAAGNNSSIAPPDDTFTAYGPPNQPFTVSVTYLTSIANWLTVTPSLGSYSNLGVAKFTIQYLQDQLQITQEANATAQIAVTTGATGVVSTAQTEVDFKVPVVITLTANPANGSLLGCSAASLATQPGCEPEFTAVAKYTPIVEFANKGILAIGGVMNLMNVDPATGKTNSLSTAVINSSSCTDHNGPSNSPPHDTVIFGGPANDDNLCPTFVGNNTPGQIGSFNFSSASLPSGLYHLVAAYQGSAQNSSAQGDGDYAPAISNTLLYRIGDAVTGAAKAGGDGQTTPIQEIFDSPLSVHVSTGTASLGGPANVTVTFTVAPGSTGASATFNGSSSMTVVTGSSGVGTTTPLLANNTEGTFTVTASVAGFGTPLTFTLTNGPAAQPNIQTFIVAKGGTLSSRNWTLRLLNGGGVAAGNLTLGRLTFRQQTGSPCTPVVTSGLPFTDALLSSVAPGNSIDVPVTISFAGCAQTSRFSVTPDLSAVNYSSQVVIANQFP